MPIARRQDQLRPRKRPTQRRSVDTVQTILRAAAQVFSARGYAGATTNHIAARAGVSIGSLYEYFPSKDALLVELFERHLTEAEDILAAVWQSLPPDAGIAELVRAFANAMVDTHANDRALHRLLFEEAPLPRATRRRLEEVEQRNAALVEAYLRANRRLSRRDPAIASTIIVQCIEAITHKLVVHGESNADPTPYVDEMVALVTSYLGARD